MRGAIQDPSRLRHRHHHRPRRSTGWGDATRIAPSACWSTTRPRTAPGSRTPAHADLYEDERHPRAGRPSTTTTPTAPSAAARGPDARRARPDRATDLKQPAPEGLTPAAAQALEVPALHQGLPALRRRRSTTTSAACSTTWTPDGLAENTIVIYTSDQGFFLGDHGWYDKRFMYEESLRMPFLVRYPREIAPGIDRRATSSLNVDFAPTFLDYAGLPMPRRDAGREPPPAAGRRTPRRLAHRASTTATGCTCDATTTSTPTTASARDRHKLIYYYETRSPTPPEWELFDLQRDPHELRSVYDDPAYAAVRAALTAELHRLRVALGDTTNPWPAEPRARGSRGGGPGRCLTATPGACPGPERPNILHLLSDQHSPFVAGCYGDPVVQTPHLDRLAAGGATLDAVYCPSPICVPSRMSMLTGRHPYQNACWTNSHILDSGHPHLRPRPRRRRLPHLPGGADALPGPRPAAGLRRAPGRRPLPQLRRQPLTPAGAPGRHRRPGPRLPHPLRAGAGGLPGARRGRDRHRRGLAEPPRRRAPQRPAGARAGPLPPLRGLHAAPPAVRRPAPGVRALPGARPRPPLPPAVAAGAPLPHLVAGPHGDRERHAGGGAALPHAPTGPWSTAWTP